MTRMCVTAIIVSACLVLVAPPVVAQSDSPVLRTPYGDPDIQGLFTFRTLTPLQRPVIDAGASAALAGKAALPAEEAAAYEASRRTELNRDTQNLAVHAPGVRYQSLAEGGVGGYNEFWYERGIELTSDKRTSLIVDPPTGRIPYREEYQAAARIRGANISNGFADSYTDRSLSDRCLMGFNAGPPMVSSAYNNNVQIVQGRDHVVILTEMVHDARIIPINSSHRPGELEPWLGDSVAWWDGDTLVVETINLHWQQAPRNAAPLTAQGKVIERFTRYSDEQIFYEFEVTDPAYYREPWRGEISFNATDTKPYEYACHEGNYGMVGILAGARRLEQLEQ